MAIAFIAVFVLLKEPESVSAEQPKVPITASFQALRNPALRTLALTALCYNFAFFVLLAYSPYPIEAAAAAAGKDFGAHELGLVFFGWGMAVAVTSVVVAPILTRRLGIKRVLFAMFVLLALAEAVLALAVGDETLLILAVIVAGLFIGVLNTTLTEAVMEATDLPRNIASGTYSGVRFFGGALAPTVAGPIAATVGAGAPYWLGVAALGAAIVILLVSDRHLSSLTHRPHQSARQEAADIIMGDA